GFGSGMHDARRIATAPVPAPSSRVRRVMLIVQPDYLRCRVLALRASLGREENSPMGGASDRHPPPQAENSSRTRARYGGHDSEVRVRVDAESVADELRACGSAGTGGVVRREAGVGDVHLAESDDVAPEVSTRRGRRGAGDAGEPVHMTASDV